MAKKQLRKDLEEKIVSALGDMASAADKKFHKAVKKASRWLADALHKPAGKKTAPKKKSVKKAAPKKKAAPSKKTVKTAAKSGSAATRS